MAEEKKKRSRSLIKNAGGLAITRLGQFKIKAQALTSKPYALVLISVDAPYHKDETILTNFFANLDSLFGNIYWKDRTGCYKKWKGFRGSLCLRSDSIQQVSIRG